MATKEITPIDETKPKNGKTLDLVGAVEAKQKPQEVSGNGDYNADSSGGQLRR